MVSEEKRKSEILTAACLKSLFFRRNSPVFLLGVDTDGVDLLKISGEDFSGLNLLFRIDTGGVDPFRTLVILALDVRLREKRKPKTLVTASFFSCRKSW